MVSELLTAVFLCAYLGTTAAAFYPSDQFIASIVQSNAIPAFQNNIPQGNKIPYFQSSLPRYHLLFPTARPVQFLQSSRANDFSACFYINLRSPIPVTQQVPILSYLAEDQHVAQIIFQLEYERQVSSFYVGGASGGFSPIVTPKNQWTHICSTWDGRLGLVNAYVGLGMTQGILTSYQIPSNGFWQLHQENVQMNHLQVVSEAEVMQVQAGTISGNIVQGDSSSTVPGTSDSEPRPQHSRRCGVPTVTSFMDIKDSSLFVTAATLRFGELIAPVRELSQFSICAWMFVKSAMSYDMICSTNKDDFCVYIFEWNVTVNLRGQTWVTNIRLDPVWNHICTTWTNSTGEITSYLNGSVVEETETHETGSFVPSANLRLYQLQNKPFDKSNPNNGFENKITDLNMWDRVITRDEANKSYCNSASGNVISNTTEWKGPEEFACGLPITSSFADIKDSELLYSTDRIYTVEQIIPFNDLREFSVCAWVYAADGGNVYMMLETDTWSDFAFAVANCHPITAVKGTIMNSSTCLQPGWAHVCISWTNSTDDITLYLNGYLEKTKTEKRTGLWIPTAKFRIYQKQSTPLEENDPTNGFDSKITELNVWDRVITSNEAYDAYCHIAEGNIVGKTTEWKGPRPHRCSPVTTSFMDIRDSIFLQESTGYLGELKTPIKELNKFSMCAWLFINTAEFKSLVCAKLVEGLCFYAQNYGLYINLLGNSWYTRITVQPEWSHICITWTSTTGKIASYQNAYIFEDTATVATGIILPPKEIDIIQTQSKVFDENDPTKGFELKVTDVKLWDRVITEDEVFDVYCKGADGNIINKTTVWRGPTCGNAILTSFMDIEDSSLLNNEDTQHIAELTTPVNELTSFSVCSYIFGPDDDFYILGTPNDYDFRYFVSGRSMTIKIKDKQWKFGIQINKVWKHFCVSWLSTTGEFKYYQDWKIDTGEITKESRSPIPSTKLRIYQTQNKPFDKNNPTKGFGSKVTELNMWDRVITEDEVFDAYCHNAVGNIINKTTEWWGPEDFTT